LAVYPFIISILVNQTLLLHLTIMSIFSLFSLMGCKANAVEEVKNTPYGNFTIRQTVETERESGKVWGREYTASSYLIKYEIYYKGKKVKFPSALQKGTEYNYLWQVYILKNAAKPALLAGSQQLFLVTEEKGQVKVTRLSHQDTEYASLQWLDSNHGLPADEDNTWQPQNDDRLDSSLVLSGGKHLLVNHFTVLNTETLQYWPFNRKNVWEINGWRISYETSIGHEIAVGFSEKNKQVVFRAIKLNEQKEGTYFTALAVFNYATDSLSILPFNRTILRLEKSEMLNTGIFHDFFEWKESGKLMLKEDIASAPWQGKLNFPDQTYINYTLYPVQESVVPAFIEFLRIRYIHSISAKDSAVVKEKDYETIVSYKIRIDRTLFEAEYSKNKYIFTFNTHYSQDFSDTCRSVIERISKDFNEALAEGKYQEHFIPFPDEGESIP
jgi:hypothetical protein